MSGNITSANAVLALSIESIYTTPRVVSGFAAEDAWDFPDVDVAEGMMGVDGVFSAGFVPVVFSMNISLQADSDSNKVFENWWAAQRQRRSPLRASGSVSVPATSRQYQLVRGVLRTYSPAPAAKKVLQPRKFMIQWEAVVPSAYVGV